ncbi:MAG: hypothetical protein ABEI86_12110, partial [Halobacteriaceae archaeon]
MLLLSNAGFDTRKTSWIILADIGPPLAGDYFAVSEERSNTIDLCISSITSELESIRRRMRSDLGSVLGALWPSRFVSRRKGEITFNKQPSEKA